MFQVAHPINPIYAKINGLTQRLRYFFADFLESFSRVSELSFQTQEQYSTVDSTYKGNKAS